MFTGLIQGVGTIRALDQHRLALELPNCLAGTDWQVGESVAVNGCCLTVVKTGEFLTFDLSPETFSRTAFHTLQPGQQVHLERAMSLGDRFGGHIVQGHVDGTATVEAIRDAENSRVISVRLDEGAGRYLIDKGSIALDGVSLTVVNPVGDTFDIWVIPHTLAMTAIGGWQPGTKLNVEFDVIAKHVEKLLSNQMVKS